MTEKLFYADAYIKEFDANVISCEENNGKFYVTLDKTAFFPEGGGQKGDRGVIGSSPVDDTIEKDGEIYHICEYPVAGDVHCSLDFKRRFNAMQGHSGEHVFSGIAHSLYGCENVGFHMGDGYITVDFNKKLEEEEIFNVEKLANEVIWQNTDIKVFYPNEEDAKKIDYRSKKEIYENLRIVSINGTDVCACCGTHVRKTGEIGCIKVGSFQNHKGGVRITLYIGSDALFDYGMKQNNLSVIANKLSSKMYEAADTFCKYEETVGKLKLENSEIKNKYFMLVAQSYKDKDVAFVCEDGLESGEISKLCSALGANVKTAVVISGSQGNGYKYAICSQDDLREKCKLFNGVLSGRGGGKPNLVQGSVTAEKEEIEKAVYEIFN